MEGVIDVFRLYFGPYFEVDDWEDWQLTPGDHATKTPSDGRSKAPI